MNTSALSPSFPPDKLESAITDMARIGCTVEEMALMLDVGIEYLHRNFLVAIEKGRAQMKYRLRQAQMDCGQSGNGNATMLIWLGKIYLGQKETAVSDMKGLLDQYYESFRQQYHEQQELCKNSPQSSLTQFLDQPQD